MDTRYLIALHIIFIVTWFSGLFYIVRLFVYHAESGEKDEPGRSILRKQYRIMEKRLWYGIAWPSMILTLVFGSWLMFLNFSYYISQAWFILKILFVAGLLLYHLQCQLLFEKFRKSDEAWSSLRLRVWNELATVFLVAIVFLVVPKQNSGWVWMGIGLVTLAAALYAGIMIYRKGRKE